MVGPLSSLIATATPARQLIPSSTLPSTCGGRHALLLQPPALGIELVHRFAIQPAPVIRVIVVNHEFSSVTMTFVSSKHSRGVRVLYASVRKSVRNSCAALTCTISSGVRFKSAKNRGSPTQGERKPAPAVRWRLATTLKAHLHEPLRQPDGMQLVWAVRPCGGYLHRSDLPIRDTSAEELTLRRQTLKRIAHAVACCMSGCDQLTRRCGVDTQAG
jgi:hypothetical protein